MSIRTAETETDTASDTAPTSSGSARRVLWLLLVSCATRNVVTSVSHMLVVSIVFGVVTLSLGTALVKQHYRGRPHRHL